ncbi:MAG: glycosyltransferase family 8 protein [Lachnospiraceae bacterium]
MIPIFFSIDDNYAPFLSVAISSLIRNASPKHSYRIIILYEELTPQNRQKISVLATENFEIRFVVMGNHLGSITNRIENCLRADYFTLTIYFRLFIPVMFPEYDKAIYLDSDTVILGDISELYRTPLEDNLIGAVADYSIVDVPPLAKYIQSGLGVYKYDYVNSGVLLMNLKKLREVRFERRFLDLMNTYHFDSIAPDQDYLNVMCKGNIHYLPASWNTMPVEGKETIKYPHIIHYNLFSKPWYYDNVPYGNYFWQYAKDSVFYHLIRSIKMQYTEKERLADRESMELLLCRGELIADAEVNFRTVLTSSGKSPIAKRNAYIRFRKEMYL